MPSFWLAQRYSRVVKCMDSIATQAYTVVESVFPRPSDMYVGCSRIQNEATFDLVYDSKAGSLRMPSS